VVGLVPGHIVLDGDPAPPPQKKGAQQLSAHVRCGQTAGRIKMPLGTEVGFGPGDFVLDGDPAPLKGTQPRIFGAYLLRPNDWIHQDISWCGGRPRPRRHCVRWGPSSSVKRAQPPPNFRPMSIVAKRLDGS